MDAAPLFVAAATAYGANCALGAAVAARVVDTRNFRWLHHLLYIATCLTTAVALSAGLWRSPPRHPGILGAVPPLAAIPYLGTHTRRHPLVALAAAPFVLAGLVLSRSADRK